MKLPLTFATLLGMLSGLTLDLILNKLAIDFVLFVVVVGAALVAHLIAHYHLSRKKHLPQRRSQFGAVKPRKATKSR
jgi:hypothetical protein